LLSGEPRREVGREPAKQAGGENIEPTRVLARGIRDGGVGLCFAGQCCHLEKSKSQAWDGPRPGIIGRVPRVRLQPGGNICFHRTCADQFDKIDEADKIHEHLQVRSKFDE
jgi:hypothetical protein